MVAVHTKTSTNDVAHINSIEGLAVQRLFKDDGIKFRGTAVGEWKDRGGVTRVIDAYVIFDDAGNAPNTAVHVDSWLKGLPINLSTHLIEASRATERDILGEPFDVFAGIYGAAVKARALRWLVESKFHDRLWVLEPDVVFTGDSWAQFFSIYADDPSDLVSVNSTLASKGGLWPHASSCTLCRLNGGWQTAFLPVFRISKTLANAVLDVLRRNLTGHHEALIPTTCLRTSGCRWANIQEGEIYRYRPFVSASEAKRRKKRYKLYHPVKSVEVFRELLS